MKKLLALLLALCVVFALFACGNIGSGARDSDAEATESTETKETEGTETKENEATGVLAEAKAHIEKGEYEKAYEKLIAIENPTEEEKALLKNFRFMPLKVEYDDESCEYTYSDDGLPLSAYLKEYDEWRKTEFTCDSKGNVLTRSYIDNYGNTGTSTYAYTYDDKGNMLTEIYTSSSGYTSTSTYTYTYDDKGNVLTETCTDSDGDTYTYAYTYDDKGNLLTKTYTSSGGSTSTTTYTWKLFYNPKFADEDYLDWLY